MRLWLHCGHAPTRASPPHRACPAARPMAGGTAVPDDGAAAGARLGLDDHGGADRGGRGGTGRDRGAHALAGAPCRCHATLPWALGRARCRHPTWQGGPTVIALHPQSSPRLQPVRPLPRGRAAPADVAVVGRRRAARQRPPLGPCDRHRPPRRRRSLSAPSGLSRSLPAPDRCHGRRPRTARGLDHAAHIRSACLPPPVSDHVMLPPRAAHLP